MNASSRTYRCLAGTVKSTCSSFARTFGNKTSKIVRGDIAVYHLELDGFKPSSLKVVKCAFGRCDNSEREKSFARVRGYQVSAITKNPRMRATPSNTVPQT